jgi:hypothetical protein
MFQTVELHEGRDMGQVRHWGLDYIPRNFTKLYLYSM